MALIPSRSDEIEKLMLPDVKAATLRIVKLQQTYISSFFSFHVNEFIAPTTTTTEEPTTTTEEPTTTTTEESTTTTTEEPTTTTEEPTTTTEELTTTTEEPTTTSTEPTTTVPGGSGSSEGGGGGGGNGTGNQGSTTDGSQGENGNTTGGGGDGDGSGNTTLSDMDKTTRSPASTSTTTEGTTTERVTTEAIPEDEREPLVMSNETRCFNVSKPDLVVADFDYDFVVVPPDEGATRVSGPPGFASPYSDNIDPVGIELDGNFCIVNSEMISSNFMECIIAPQNCSTGFSFSIWLKTEYPEDGETMTLFTTGMDVENGKFNPGLHGYIKGIYIHIVVVSEGRMWEAIVSGGFYPSRWYNLATAWGSETGLKVYIQNVRVAWNEMNLMAAPHEEEVTVPKFVIGCNFKIDAEQRVVFTKKFSFVASVVAFWNATDTNATRSSDFAGCYGHDKDMHDKETQDIIKCSGGESCDNALYNALFVVRKSSHVSSELGIQALGDLLKLQVKNAENPEEAHITVEVLKNDTTASFEQGSGYGDEEMIANVPETVANATVQLFKITSTDNSQELVSAFLVSEESCTAEHIDELATDAAERVNEKKFNIFHLEELENLDMTIIAGTAAEIISMADKRGFISVPGHIRVYVRSMYGEHVTIIGVSGTVVHSHLGSCNVDHADEKLLSFVDLQIVGKTYKDASGFSRLTIEMKAVKKLMCVRWDDTLKVNAMQLGGWTEVGIETVDVDDDDVKCETNYDGLIALKAILKKQFVIPKDAEWLKYVKYVGYGLSCLLLVFYIVTIFSKENLHEMFHLVRFNTACAALGALSCFFSSEMMRHDEEACVIIGGFLQFFYTAVACWLVVEAHALFGAVISGIISGKLKCYLPVAWGIPALIVGANVGLFPEYGDDYLCMTGHDPIMRWLLFGPIMAISGLALIWTAITACNVGTPAIRKEYVAGELGNGTRSLFCVSVLYTATWIFAILAYIDLDLDIPTFYPIFQVLNSWLGVIIVMFMGAGSKHFRRCVCGKGVPVGPPKCAVNGNLGNGV
ncbi:Cadherin EGF LAG seven-pass G-type receptor 1 [Nymphon striatum]|nr:Cadherin EGF LAG seven-pass G-type receptor 1 [Nymphon striatum]